MMALNVKGGFIMGGVTNAVMLVSVLTLFVFLGFAYLILVAAKKETGVTKLTGLVIAAVIAILAVLAMLYVSILGPTMKERMMARKGCCPMMKQSGGCEMGKMKMMGEGMMKHKDELRKEETAKKEGFLKKEMGRKHKGQHKK